MGMKNTQSGGRRGDTPWAQDKKIYLTQRRKDRREEKSKHPSPKGPALS